MRRCSCVVIYCWKYRNGLWVGEPKLHPMTLLVKDRRCLRRRRLNAQRRNAGAHGPSRARLPASMWGAYWGPLAEGPFFNGALVPKIN